MADILIQAAALHKSYASGDAVVKALDGVDLVVERGAFVVLSGRSGSGKTTLLNMFGALDRPDCGTLTLAGQDLLAMSAAERARFRLRHLGFVFQAYNLIRVLNARENVAYVLQLQGMDKKQRFASADRWLAAVGLAGFEQRRPDQMSGGQQQRVAVARALAAAPDLILADEPTANLDSHNGESLIALMERLNREEGTTFVIASHDPTVIAAARTLVTMQDGRIEAVNHL
ncbi:ABC transporter ATP-binding protein [Mariprofundus erugo]|uniref:ABC transporter ATP-binding protein n=1 Tax=Mariprofundus erugo TaxID=2528639 RepID=A0A5R9GW92_9PROT|nr:ABC transporter ATP-binding protein [Mariprofundus erugo]TLS67354.1 ABC transporter ATP-binding protein [Mariprofundus erugo]TLS73957.1 ABC transporter ATP-binding protein [Mariprofundus erugo]